MSSRASRGVAAAASALALLGGLAGPAAAQPSPPEPPPAAQSYEVRTPTGVGVVLRSEPDASSKRAGRVDSGSTVLVECHVVDGSPVAKPRGGTSRIWNRTPDGRFLTDVHTITGTWDPVGLPCSMFDRQRSEAAEQARDIELMEQMRRRDREDPVTCIGHRHQNLDQAHAARVSISERYTPWTEVLSTPEIPDKVVDEIKKRSKVLGRTLGRTLLVDRIEVRERIDGWRLEWCRADGMAAWPQERHISQFQVFLLGAPIEMKDDPLSVPTFVVTVPNDTVDVQVGPIQHLTAEMDRQAVGCYDQQPQCLLPGQNTAPSHPGAQPPPRHPR